MLNVSFSIRILLFPLLPPWVGELERGAAEICVVA